MSLTTPSIQPYRPDLFLALVVPLGAPVEALRDELEEAMRRYGYDPVLIKLSGLLKSRAGDLNLSVREDAEHHRVKDLMDVGDALCKASGSAAAVLVEAIAEIGVRRSEQAEAGQETPVAWILDSLKRPAELEQLRHLYGDHAIVISAQADHALRLETLEGKVRRSLSADAGDESADRARDLIVRDWDDLVQDPMGQNTLKSFPKADLFVDCGQDPAGQVKRFVDLLFGNPAASTPTRDEFGMFAAMAAATKSPELGRRVGAAILKDGAIASVGCNAHPVHPDRVPDADSSRDEIRTLVAEVLEQLATAGVLEADAVSKLGSDRQGFVDSLAEGPMKNSQLLALTEFQLPVHAEMAALLDALKRGVAIADGKIYVTSYPCHGCAKHLLRCGITGVYVEPYPKSRAEAMYGQDATIAFTPFTGVAPRRYRELFDQRPERKQAQKPGQGAWGREERIKAEPLVIDLTSVEKREDLLVSTRLPLAGVSDADGTVKGTEVD